MSHKDNYIRLRHMLDATEELVGFISGKSYDDLLMDRALQHVCLHCLQIIGEAANLLELDFRDKHPEIPWRSIIAMRNRLIHAYFDVDLSIIWDTITINIPTLFTQLRILLAEER